MTTYNDVKAAVIEVVDDFTEKDVTDNYAPKGSKKYSAKTKLESLSINGAVKATMPYRFNKVLAPLCKPLFQPVGSLHFVELKTVGDVVKLACRAGQVPMPPGEPT